MDIRGDKRTIGIDSPSTSQSTPKKQKKQYVISEKTDADKHSKNAKKIMDKIKPYLTQCAREDNNKKKLTEYIRENIRKLDKITKKKTTVGVFGKTGAGKSSLINAILGENDLLPSGTVCACTSVIIQVEANTESNYTAEIEFISKQDWENELKTLLNVLSEDSEDKDCPMFSTANDKITALYGEEGVFMSTEDLMKEEHFKEIPEFLDSGLKKITREEASNLSDEIQYYVQHNDSGRCYWPVVKSVTIKVPNCNELLENVVLVDLPGTGDYNKTRDQMWKSTLRDCSTVWIVSEINRAGSDKEAWELVSSSITEMAQGGECSSISFICTKTDDIDPRIYMRSLKLTDDSFQITSEDSQYSKKKEKACIIHRNNKAKDKVKKNFLQQTTIKRHFNCDDNFLLVFTVSSKKFTSEDLDSVLKPEETEIPALRDLLRKYNNSHTNDVATQYISGALGILYLIQGSKHTDDEMAAERSKLWTDLETNLDNGLEHLQEYCDQIYSSLEELLSNGAKESEEKCEETAEKVITPKNKDGRGFHRTLTALCKNDGFYRSKKGKTDLNKSLADHMLQNIDKIFSDVFPVDGTGEKSLQANIDKFSMIPDELTKQHDNSPALAHILNFLKIEERKMQTFLKQDIVQQKKKIYASLSESIKTSMQPGYERAAEFSGTGSMLKKQATLLQHIESSKSEMFQKAKMEMLQLMENTANFTVTTIRTKLKESMDYSLKENTFAYMDVNREIEELKRILDQMRSINYKNL